MSFDGRITIVVSLEEVDQRFSVVAGCRLSQFAPVNLPACLQRLATDLSVGTAYCDSGSAITTERRFVSGGSSSYLA